MFMRRDWTSPTKGLFARSNWSLRRLDALRLAAANAVNMRRRIKDKAGTVTLHTNSTDANPVAAALYPNSPRKEASTVWLWIACLAGRLELARFHALSKTHFCTLILSRLRVSQIVVVDGRLEPTFADR